MIDEELKEIHEIRAKLYEETKNLSVDDMIKKIKQGARETIEKYGVKVRKYTGVNFNN